MAKLLSVDVLGIVYSVVKGCPVWGLIGGKVFKGNKALNHTGECIVINALPITGVQHQKCVVIINVFVPNRTDIGNGTDKTQANYPRIKELSDPISTLLTDYYHDDYSLIIEQEYITENEGFNEHYNEFRVKFRNVNI